MSPLPPQGRKPLTACGTLHGHGNTAGSFCQSGDTRAFDNVLYMWDGSKWVQKE
jgi:hypothetical protein